MRAALRGLGNPGACIFQRTSLPVAGMYGNGTVITTSHVVIPGTVTGIKATVAGDSFPIRQVRQCSRW